MAQANTVVPWPSRILRTVFDAIDVLDQGEIRALVEAIPSREALGGPDQWVIDFSDFWANGVCCALSASALSRRLAIAEPRDVYPLGVLHKIGRALLCLAAPPEMAEILRRSNPTENSILRAEQVSFGFTQEEVSARLLRMRGLPDSIAISVQYQSKPRKAPAYQEECALLHIAAEIAEWIRPTWTTSNDPDQLMSRLDPFALEVTSADELILNEVCSEVSITLTYVEDLIDILPSPASARLES